MADGVIKSSGPRPACDRCRGQKLRCVWEISSQQCRRCARAKAVCTIPRARPMGRPPRQCRDNSSYFGCEDGHPQSLEEDPILGMQSSDESMPLDGESGPPRAMGNALTGEPLWGLAPSIEGHKTAGLPSPDPLEFLNYFAEPTMGGIFSMGLEPGSGGLHSTPTTTAPIATFNTPNRSDPGLFMAPTLGPDVVADGHQRPEDHNKAHQHDRKDDYVQCLTQLCQLNVALYQHPLYANPGLGNAFHAQMMRTPASSGHSSPTSPCLSDLKMGRLLSMTVQLRNLVAGIASVDGGKSLDEAPHGADHVSPDRSTALIVLSCYSRLDVIYTRAVDILRDVQRRGVPLRPSDCLMPSLAIDGFSLASCHGIQLTFIIQLCEQTLDSIRECMRKCGESQDR
ncbi:Zn(II)2Cys6 transcription factor domain-containing protein [Aspergillus affinis]|uniref:Zn(II)2Cys6 transcription factor domain-containing protein n=1 Tax=Aspergillus affinis TaxID=1070780 RepID=UPI0022FEA577|nr:uncharacterized protein KD926_000607 [Aspergillus affinis]KAI9037320.1 hypothetical protein KD926_000607 [Aspergillus affinis]